jgi:hypothetical protein
MGPETGRTVAPTTAWTTGFFSFSLVSSAPSEVQKNADRTRERSKAGIP